MVTFPIDCVLFSFLINMGCVFSVSLPVWKFFNLHFIYEKTWGSKRSNNFTKDTGPINRMKLGSHQETCNCRVHALTHCVISPYECTWQWIIATIGVKWGKKCRKNYLLTLFILPLLPVASIEKMQLEAGGQRNHCTSICKVSLPSTKQGRKDGEMIYKMNTLEKIAYKVYT